MSKNWQYLEISYTILCCFIDMWYYLEELLQGMVDFD